MPMKKSTEPRETQQRRLESKWGRELMSAGYTVIPNAILEHQSKLGLDAVDLAIIVHLVRHWWDAERLPYPTKATLAELLGVDRRTIQRRIAAMEQAGVIERVERFAATGSQASNEYRLSGLIDRAKPLAKQMLKEREEATRKKRVRRKRGLRASSIQGEQ